ncbi:sugar ABC transporter substrate-binding protein [Marilutibacter chinensis]|uniref:Sugar ABC transporter substrate-binding protein n=1 Tax=Marilutibacter chinensis TaxID=2912247 RepID=A0ABS9HMF5_9GAMM|nr:sugar ABC transporter substrate-binding protein [Lysobacter chinensis]MCF7220209.1 sugar ABC transporter substrate-binding protein [Lysobacter chinensis]
MSRFRAACAVFACLMTLLALLAGCTGGRDDRTVVRFWAMGYEGEVVARLMPEFERRHPEIRVEVQQLPWTAAHEKLLTAFAGDALPDVCALGNTWIPEFALLDALEPLGPMLARTPSIEPADYFDGAWDSGVIEGQVYAVPWYVETRLPFYRSDLLAEAGIERVPEDWAQWREALDGIKRHVGPQRYSILLPLNEFEPLLNLAIQQPDPLLREDGRYGNFRSPGFKRALTFYKEMFDLGWAPPVSNTQISNVWDEFGRGYYAFYINGPWNIAEFRKRLPAERADDWMTMPLPGPEGPGSSVAGGTSFVLFRQSGNREAAWKLVEFLSDPWIQARFHAMTGDLPPRRSTWRHGELAADPHANAFRQQLERARPAPRVPEWERIAQEMRLVGEQMVGGHYTVDEAAAELDRRADAILEKRRWMLDRRVAGGGR